MKILLSAYACEPGKGSEPGVGWGWALGLARRGHEVTVITRANNAGPISSALQSMAVSEDNLNFIYYDLPIWLRFWKRRGFGIRFYYLLWQWGAYLHACRMHKRKPFEQVHHVTFVSLRQPSFMGGLGIPFVFGPLAGGERAPLRLRSGFSFRGWIVDFLRDLINSVVRIDPLMHQTFRKADQIYVTSRQSLALIPQQYRYKVAVKLAIGIDDEQPLMPATSVRQTPIRVLYIGRFIYWKGMHLGLVAMAGLLQAFPDARLTMVGKGPDEKRWRREANKLGIAGSIDWVAWVDQKEISAIYTRHDIFLFPSLHDSGGMVVLEALAHGLPTVCLDLGGPGVMVNDNCGRVIPTSGKSTAEVGLGLGRALVDIASDKDLYRQLQQAAYDRPKAFGWDRLIASIYPENSK